MKIQYMSDLHGYPKLEKKGDILIVAGDVSPDWEMLNAYLEDLNVDILVPGNHEYYGHHIDEEIGDDLVVKNMKGLLVACATFWPDVSDIPETTLKYNLNDFRYIKGMTKEKMIELHDEAYAFLANCKADIAVTHFPPIHIYPEKYNNSYLVDYFYNDCEELLYKFKVWIYGHTHRNIDKEVNGCKVVTNPYGYVHEWLAFDYDKMIEV